MQLPHVMRKRVAAPTLIATLSVACTGPALAQLDDIVVTARKKEETLQTVPIAITAFSAQEIERIRIRDIQDIASFTPGLSYQNINGTLQLPVIRGLAQTNITGAENNVSNFINGIYLSNNRALDVALVDLERVEVLRGPQSAVYGRNSFAGAISYVTAKPSDEFEAYARATVGDDELWELKGSVSGPITDTLKARLAVMANSFDGTFKNEVSDDNLQGYEGYGVHGALDWQILDNFTAELFVYYADQDNDHPAQVFIPNNCGVSGTTGAPTYLCGTVPVPDSWSVSTDAFGLESENTILGLTLNWQLNDNWSITSLTGWSDSESSSLLDNDMDGVGGVFAITDAPFGAPTGTVITNGYLGQGQTTVEDFSQELRLVYASDSLSGSIGAYYYDSDISNASVGGIDTRPLAPGEFLVGFLGAAFGVDDPVNNLVPSNLNEDTVETIAIFGELSYQFTDQFSLSGELRYTDEEKTTDRILNFTLPGAGFDKTSFDFVTFRAIGNFQATDDQLYYLSIASGARSGGFNSNATLTSENSFEEETNITYELGAKTEWLDNRLLANVALYYVDWTDLQIASRSQDPNNIFAVTRNSGDATSVGLEIELNALITDNFRAGLGYAWTDPEFEDGAQDLGLNNSLESGICGSDDSVCPNGTDVSGQQLGRTVENQFNANLEYTGSVGGDWEWYARGDLAWFDKQPVRAANVQFLDSYTVVNARIGIQNERYEIALWAKNLFDEEYLTAVSLQPRFNSGNITDTTQANLRTWGITGQINFGGAGR